MRASPTLSKYENWKEPLCSYKLWLERRFRSKRAVLLQRLEFHSPCPPWGLTTTCNSNLRGSFGLRLAHVQGWVDMHTWRNGFLFLFCLLVFCYFLEQTIGQRKMMQNFKASWYCAKSRLHTCELSITHTHIHVRHGVLCLEFQRVRGWGNGIRNSVSSWTTHQVWGHPDYVKTHLRRNEESTCERLVMVSAWTVKGAEWMREMSRLKTTPTAELQLNVDLTLSTNIS